MSFLLFIFTRLSLRRPRQQRYELPFNEGYTRKLLILLANGVRSLLAESQREIPNSLGCISSTCLFCIVAASCCHCDEQSI